MDQALLQLYSDRLLALAADVPLTGRLEAPDGTAMARSPLCGSQVTVDLRLEAGRIVDFRQDVRACALGQAAAAVVGQAILGRDRAEVTRARAELAGMLKSDGPAPSAPFEGLEALLPARDFPNRHASILLALEATLAAFQQAEGR